jgi:hypothetical protein
VPLVSSLPLQLPLAVHAVAFVEDQVSVALAPRVIVVGSTEIVAVGAGGALTATVAVALALPPCPLHSIVYVEFPVEPGVSIFVPLVACEPLQLPLAVQEVAFVDDHVRVVVAPSTTLVGLAVRVTVGLG